MAYSASVTPHRGAQVKVVLNIRPIESWFKSVQVLGKIYEPSLLKTLLCLLDPLFHMQFQLGRTLAVHVFGYDEHFKTLFRNDGSTEKVYEVSVALTSHRWHQI